ncbi:hypothetical protein [Flavivirga eckloniae]|uniref:Uncharacterized protein n=1 Tax=Flavivirga eckloniae TaxID=1803846 RepID=A0A2K9PTK3_9FLAO|nr:hypothetical protein [Flavivirga eckloniae]AUP80396.1 hypothetical protein C1H87_17435 [Flavivirga eckloniae]
MSCSNDNDQNPIVHETYIQGIVNSKLENYQQINLKDTNVSNTFFSESKETWLQAYKNKDQLTSGGYWSVRIHDLDIIQASLPYSNWTNNSADIAWDNNLAIEDQRCGGIDSGCKFIGSTTDGLNLTITEVTDNFITGEFSGRFFLTGTGFGHFKDESTFVDVENGAFKIKFSVTNE